jgi:3-phenylpropionate/trans-cinnamate dioxygenase ferredoxin reductase component
MEEGIVTVGAGEAGARAAFALREAGWRGPITLIGDEAHAPYERPPLSKAVMTAEAPPSAPFILREGQLKEHGIVLESGTKVTGIDRASHSVTLTDGRVLRYARLLLATGSTARRLHLPGAQGILYLRKFDDALVLRSRLRSGGRLVVIGGGFIGLELAASARARGAEVILLELAPRLLTRGVSFDMAERIAAKHRDAGVDLRVGVSITAVESHDEGNSVLLSDGARIPCDAVVAGIGAVPETGLAERAGLTIENGIRVDAQLRTDDPDIYAAGDCCSFPHPLYNDRRIRLEAWRNAQDQANLAARNLAGGRESYRAVPWFWSDQYDHTLHIAGLVDEGRTTIVRDLGEATLAFHLADDGRLVAASGFGPISKVAKDIRLAEMLIARKARPAAVALAAPEVKLKSLLAA